MSQLNEVTLAVIPGSTEGDRLIVVHKHRGSSSQIELRQQTWGEGIGWFTQNSLPLETDQVAQLRATLGGPSAPWASAATVRFNHPRSEQPQLRLHAESA